MNNYRTRRFISIAVVIIIVAVAVIGLVYFAQLLFFPNSNNTLTDTNTHESDLISTTADRAVRMNVRGPIVADENFRTYQIQITPSNRTFTTYKGYLNQTASNESLGNNIPAYEQFVNALNRAKFMDPNVFTGSANNTSGVCATGYLYTFSILNSDKTIKQLWSTSCGAPRGSFGGNVSAVRNLFTVQIPNGQQKIGKVWR